MEKTTLKITLIIIFISLFVGCLGGLVAGFYAANLVINNDAPFLYSFLYQKIFNQTPKIESNEPNVERKNIEQSNLSENNDSLISEEQKTVSVVEKVNPSVVSIVVSKYVSQYYGLQKAPFNNDFFNEFFNFNSPFFEFNAPQNLSPKSDESPNQEQEKEKEKQQIGGGTGFIISSKDGLILTNKHVVVDEEAEYSVITNDGQEYKATVLARDPFNDIAVLKVEEKNLSEVELGDSDRIKIGQTVIAIGNALGEYRNTVTQGVISGISRKIVAGGTSGQSETLDGVIQTDAAINFGNSGGPLIDLNGKVIGINTAISQEGQLIGFAIPINQAKQAIESVKKYGKIVRPYLGVRYVIINESIAKANKLTVDYGALILRGEGLEELAVIPGSPANKAGLVENDIILEINNQKITEDKSLAKEIQKYKPGAEVKLKIYHQGEKKEITVTLEEYKE